MNRSIEQEQQQDQDQDKGLTFSFSYSVLRLYLFMPNGPLGFGLNKHNAIGSKNKQTRLALSH